LKTDNLMVLHHTHLDRDYGCFMMRPSATADVEATLVHGAQEARSLNVFFLLRTVSV
jgi:hypothetical protein